MSEKFSNAEIAVVRKFLAWVAGREWIDSDSYGITGMCEDGFKITRFSAINNCGVTELEGEDSIIPFLTLTDPAQGHPHEGS